MDHDLRAIGAGRRRAVRRRAVYINVAEHPARLALDDRAAVAEWAVSYPRGYAMQASLAILGFVLGVAAWWATGRWPFLLGAALLVANWPFTLLAIMPVNRKLEAIASGAAADGRRLLERWALLHAGRSALGAGATLVLLLATLG